jgi:hypothetical protein
MATFNGHKNWNHVSLWINNDESIYEQSSPTLDHAAHEMLPTHTTIRAALRGIR